MPKLRATVYVGPVALVLILSAFAFTYAKDSAWWTGLEPKDRLEIIKILIDKGLLALIVAIAGFIFSLYIERYKALEARRLQQTQIVIPKIYQLMEDADILWKDA